MVHSVNKTEYVPRVSFPVPRMVWRTLGGVDRIVGLSRGASFSPDVHKISPEPERRLAAPGLVPTRESASCSGKPKILGTPCQILLRGCIIRVKRDQSDHDAFIRDQPQLIAQRPKPERSGRVASVHCHLSTNGVPDWSPCRLARHHLLARQLLAVSEDRRKLPRTLDTAGELASRRGQATTTITTDNTVARISATFLSRRVAIAPPHARKCDEPTPTGDASA